MSFAQGVLRPWWGLGRGDVPLTLPEGPVVMTYLSVSATSLRSQRYRLLASTCLIALSCPVGSTVASAQEAIEIPTIDVYSATLVPTPADQVASSVTVITAEDIERQQATMVTQVLNSIPGMNFAQYGGNGGQGYIYMRGTEPRHTKVLLDGVDMSDASTSDGSADLHNITTADIERIEVLRGPQSGLYGSDAIGGVISITTKKGQGPAKVTASVEGGSQETFNQSAGFSGTQNNFNYAFNIVHLRETAVTIMPDRLNPLGIDVRDNAYDNKTLSTRLGYEFNENLEVSWIGRLTDTRYRYSGLPTTPSTEFSYQDGSDVTNRGEAIWTAFDGRLKSYFAASYTDQHRDLLSGSGKSSSWYDGAHMKYDWHSVAKVMPGQTLVVGADHQTDYYDSSTQSGLQVGDMGTFAEWQSNFSDRVFVTSNIRYDDHETFGGHTTYRVAPAVLLPGTETKLKGSYGTGFKAPSLFQLYGNYVPYHWALGNTALQPEESTGWDAGFEQPLQGGRFRFGATYFHNDVTNLIETPSCCTAKYENVSAAKISGVETFVDWLVAPSLRLRGDYTYTDAENAETGVELIRRPKNKASLMATWTPTEAFTLTATLVYHGQFVNGYDGDNRSSAYRDGYTLVNVAAEYKYDKRTTVFGRIDNLFDAYYEYPYNYVKPGISFFGGVRVALEAGNWAN